MQDFWRAKVITVAVVSTIVDVSPIEPDDLSMRKEVKLEGEGSTMAVKFWNEKSEMQVQSGKKDTLTNLVTRLVQQRKVSEYNG